MSIELRDSAPLSEPFNRRLGQYALAATAAGVGMLALVQSAQAKIVYTKTHHVIGKNHLFLLDLNHDGTIDFTITNLNCAYGATSCTSSSWNLLTVAGGSGNAVQGTAHRFGFWAADLRAGTRIPNERNSDRTAMMASQCEGVACSVTSGTHTSGNWRDARDRYLGLKFQIHQKAHFGWARLSVKTARRPIEIKTTLTGFAYETTPNKPIIAGQAKRAGCHHTGTRQPRSVSGGIVETSQREVVRRQ